MPVAFSYGRSTLPVPAVIICTYLAGSKQEMGRYHRTDDLFMPDFKKVRHTQQLSSSEFTPRTKIHAGLSYYQTTFSYCRASNNAFDSTSNRFVKSKQQHYTENG